MNGSSLRMLRAMFWKECRENGKWALLGMAALAVALAYGLLRIDASLGVVARPFDEFWATLNAYLLLGAAPIALLLGLAQTLPEQRRDQWAFLIHRPASRTILFWGKAAAGLALYLTATSVPLVVFSAWAATPGNMDAPFDPRLMLAGAASILCGANIYFAALTVGLRPARWCGGRILPLIAAAAIAYVIMGISGGEFWQMAVWESAIMLVLAAAAWGSFAAINDEARRSWTGRASLTLLLFVGSAVVCGTIFSLGKSLWDQARRLSQPQQASTSSVEYGVLTSGRIVRVTYSPKAGGASNEVVVSKIRDLDGRTLTVKAGALAHNADVTLRRGDITPPSLLDVSFMSPGRYIQTVGAPLGAAAASVSPGVTSEPYSWFYLAARRRFEVYSKQTRRLIGEIGASGFVRSGAGEAPPFPGYPLVLPLADAGGGYLYVFNRQMYRIVAANQDADAPALETLRTLPVLRQPMREEILSVTNSHLALPRAHETEYFLNSRDGITAVSASGAKLFFIPVPPGEFVSMTLLPKGSADAGRGPGSFRYFFWTGNGDVGPNSSGAQVVTEYSGTGKILRRWMLPALPSPHYVSTDIPSEMVYAVMTPVVAPVAIASHPPNLSYSRLAAIGLIFGALWAAFAWAIARRAGLTVGQCVLAALSGLLLGLPAAATLLARHRWPARVACPRCRRHRAVTRDLCERCGAPFLAPLRDGSEIFDPVHLTLHSEEAA